MRKFLIGLAGAVALPGAAMFAMGATPAGAATIVTCKTFSATTSTTGTTNLGKCSPTTNGSTGTGSPAVFNCGSGCLTGTITWHNGKTTIFTDHYSTPATNTCPITGATIVKNVLKVGSTAATGGTATTLRGGKGSSTDCVNPDGSVTLAPGTFYKI